MSEKIQAWNFTYIGGTVSKKASERSRVNFASETVFPLSSAQVGDLVVIQQIPSRDMKLRLRNMGLALDSKVEVISKTPSGSIIVCIQAQQIGLGAEMAKHVMVTLATERS